MHRLLYYLKKEYEDFLYTQLHTLSWLWPCGGRAHTAVLFLSIGGAILNTRCCENRLFGDQKKKSRHTHTATLQLQLVLFCLLDGQLSGLNTGWYTECVWQMWLANCLPSLPENCVCLQVIFWKATPENVPSRYVNSFDSSPGSPKRNVKKKRKCMWTENQRWRKQSLFKAMDLSL